MLLRAASERGQLAVVSLAVFSWRLLSALWALAAFSVISRIALLNLPLGWALVPAFCFTQLAATAQQPTEFST